jgi:hypothetical protein
MERKRPEAGDRDNVPFEAVSTDLHHVTPGFDAGETQPQTGNDDRRFPRRSSEEEVPRTSLAARLHGGPQRESE